MEKIKDAADFDAKVLKNKLPVLVDFSATWCGPCRAMEPILNEFSKTYDGKVAVYKVDVDELGDVAGKYGIQSIPTMILMKNGEIVAQRSGSMPKDMLETWVKENFKL